MNGAGSIVVVASLNVDHVVRTPLIPSPGETVLGSSWSSALGGKGGNQAVAAARLGTGVVVVGCVGADPEGDRYREALVTEGIDVARVTRTDRHATGAAAVMVAADGANSIVVVPGANSAVDAEAARAAVTDGVRIVVGQLEVCVDATEVAFRAARARAALAVLNPAPAGPGFDRLLGLSDIVVPNEIEFEQLTGCDPRDDAGLRRGVAGWLDAGVRWVVVTLGADGCVAVDAHGVHRVAADRAEVVDTTAAGDSFVGALAVALTGLSFEEVVAACRFGVRVAAVTVSRSGAQPSLPTMDELVTDGRGFDDGTPETLLGKWS